MGPPNSPTLASWNSQVSPGELSIQGPAGKATPARDGVRVLGFLLGSLQV